MKKTHMMKFEIMTDTNRKIPNISEIYSCRTHDFKIRKMSDHIPKDSRVLVYSGYQGLQKQYQKTIQLHKRRRTSSLLVEQLDHNRSLTSK